MLRDVNSAGGVWYSDIILTSFTRMKITFIRDAFFIHLNQLFVIVSRLLCVCVCVLFENLIYIPLNAL